nr:MAG TPA: hypothetical protein [Caudoviricetes sp.]
MTTSGTAQSGAPLLSSFQSAAPYGFSFRSCRLTLFALTPCFAGCFYARNGVQTDHGGLGAVQVCNLAPNAAKSVTRQI